MTGVSTSGTSSRESLEQKVESLFHQVKYLQDQLNGRPGMVGSTNGKFPGGLPSGSVIASPSNGGGLRLATVGVKGRVDAEVEINSTTQSFSGVTRTNGIPTSIDVDTGKWIINIPSSSTIPASIAYNDNGTVYYWPFNRTTAITSITNVSNGWGTTTFPEVNAALNELANKINATLAVLRQSGGHGLIFS